VATLNHLDTISHFAERETGRNARLGTAVALHYEALFRRSLDARCRNLDPEITGLTKIEDMLLKVDEHILEIARTRIMTTLQKAGLSLDQVSGSGGGGAHGGTEFEGALLKQEARADQMRKSADGARKQAQKEKEESDRAWRLTNGDHRNSKERHRDKFWEELQSRPDYVPNRNSANDGGGTGGSFGNAENWRQQPYGGGKAAGKQSKGAKPGKPGKGGKHEKGGNNRR